MQKSFSDILNKVPHYSHLLSDATRNVTMRRNYDVLYITEDANWAIKTIAASLSKYISKNTGLRVATSITNFGARARLLHFGSPHVLSGHGIKHELQRSASHVLTVYHVEPAKGINRIIMEQVDHLDVIHTACQSTKKQLGAVGIPDRKIKVIPLGVDTQVFSAMANDQRNVIRKKLNIPKNALVIGSFQKDGEGWQKGVKPKYIKGPDILLKTLAEVSKQHPIHALLAGPARGYVIAGLKEHHIPYTYVGYVNSLHDIARLYHALDIYLITSRLEGGPKQILEAWASGIPVVTTPVGMIPDIAVHQKNALIAPTDPLALAQAVLSLAENIDLRTNLSTMGLRTIPRFAWDQIAQHYYAELYQPFLEQ